MRLQDQSALCIVYTACRIELIFFVTSMQQSSYGVFFSSTGVQEHARNVAIKDNMRDTCVPELVESWYQIMVSYPIIVKCPPL